MLGRLALAVSFLRSSRVAAFSAMTPQPQHTLLVTSIADEASCVMREAMLDRGGWEVDTGQGLSEGRLYRHERTPTWMIDLDAPMLGADNLDEAFEAKVLREQGEVSNVIFLSKHAAASGQPALTVHPIGVPNPTAKAEFGGRSGKCVPPNPYMARCLRILHEVAQERGMTEEFDITLEATHHGPWLDSPSMFVEIGSSEEHWGRKDAASAWGEVLTRLLGLEPRPAEANSTIVSAWPDLDEATRADSKVLVGLGGGHYAPKHGDLARKEGFFMGHILPNYCFDWEGEGWRHAVGEAVRATQQAYPGASVKCFVDKKSFKGWQRDHLIEVLQLLGVKWCYKPAEV